jgi:hypothetical protein
MKVPRRVVTGHDAAGRGVVISDGPAAVSRQVADGASFYELWATTSSPAPIEAVEPGDLVVQRGTDHAWENRGGERVRVLFVLLDGRFGEALLQTLAPGVRSGLMHDVP